MRTSAISRSSSSTALTGIPRRRSKSAVASRKRHQAGGRAGRGELLAIVDAWRRATAIEAFFDDATNRAADLRDQERAQLRDRMDTARKMLGGTDALAWFRRWRTSGERFTAAEKRKETKAG